jgi:hypothetical protein
VGADFVLSVIDQPHIWLFHFQNDQGILDIQLNLRHIYAHQNCVDYALFVSVPQKDHIATLRPEPLTKPS